MFRKNNINGRKNRGLSMRKYMSRNNNSRQDGQGVVKNQNTMVLKEGKTGEEIEILQNMLINVASIYPNILILTVNGVFDDNTKTAVKQFQENVGIEPTGIVDMNTWNKLLAVNEKNFSNANIPEYLDQSSNILKEGSEGKFVIKLQEYLNVISNKYTVIPKLVVDGRFGPKTKEAVLIFQRIFNIVEDGIVGRVTWNLLYNEYLNLISKI